MGINFKHYLSHLTEQPGVYQILDSQNTVLYVGKARNLKKRVSQYFHAHLANLKTFALMQQADHIEVIITASETEALLLENSLIKDKKPRYNVLLKDDKSYPYLFLSKGDFPRLDLYRGNKNLEGAYYGPYTSVAILRKNLNFLQKLFKIRQCEDGFFRHRKRPCLQYYINRCTAPCVGYVSAEDYQGQVKDAVLFLEGKSEHLLSSLEARMQKEAKALHYEMAARLRDQIRDLKEIQAKQYVVDQTGEFDVITWAESSGLVCVGILKMREGRLLEQHEYFPHIPDGMLAGEALSSFLCQYYLNVVPVGLLPKHIAVQILLPDSEHLAQMLSKYAEKKISIMTPKRGKAMKWIALGLKNTTHALNRHLAVKSSYAHQLEELKRALGIVNPIRRIECFDISHSSGESPVASQVVFGLEGPIKMDYRRFNIKSLTSKGDDYGAMREVFMRRYQKTESEELKKPDLIMVDGGRGQLNVAMEVLETLGIKGITIIGIAKGEGRKAGLEKLWLPQARDPLILPADSMVLHLLQRIRDEAHRFAILGHRQQRDKKRSHSFLEEIPGIGAKRRRLLLSRFGGLQQLKQATMEEIAGLPGFSQTIAKRIYHYLNNGSFS